jgi:hypothetical protein
VAVAAPERHHDARGEVSALRLPQRPRADAGAPGARHVPVPCVCCSASMSTPWMCMGRTSLRSSVAGAVHGHTVQPTAPAAAATRCYLAAAPAANCGSRAAWLLLLRAGAWLRTRPGWRQDAGIRLRPGRASAARRPRRTRSPPRPGASPRRGAEVTVRPARRRRPCRFPRPGPAPGDPARAAASGPGASGRGTRRRQAGIATGGRSAPRPRGPMTVFIAEQFPKGWWVAAEVLGRNRRRCARHYGARCSGGGKFLSLGREIGVFVTAQGGHGGGLLFQRRTAAGHGAALSISAISIWMDVMSAGSSSRCGWQRDHWMADELGSHGASARLGHRHDHDRDLQPPVVERQISERLFPAAAAWCPDVPGSMCRGPGRRLGVFQSRRCLVGSRRVGGSVQCRTAASRLRARRSGWVRGPVGFADRTRFQRRPTVAAVAEPMRGSVWAAPSFGGTGVRYGDGDPWWASARSALGPQGAGGR